jgi:hypothetical protein
LLGPVDDGLSSHIDDCLCRKSLYHGMLAAALVARLEIYMTLRA